MRENAVLIRPTSHVLCDLGVVSVHENARIGAFPRKQISGPEYGCEFAITALRKLSEGWPCFSFQRGFL